MSAEGLRFVVSGPAAVRLQKLYSELALIERGVDELRANDASEAAAWARHEDVRQEISTVVRVYGHFEGPTR